MDLNKVAELIKHAQQAFVTGDQQRLCDTLNRLKGLIDETNQTKGDKTVNKPSSVDIRIVIAVDITVSNTSRAAYDAYDKLCHAMAEVEKAHPESITWESTDEWFDPDGDSLTEDFISSVRREWYSRDQRERPTDD